jgi:hypothetical protein
MMGHESLDVTLAYLKGPDAACEPVQELVANRAGRTSEVVN